MVTLSVTKLIVLCQLYACVWSNNISLGHSQWTWTDYTDIWQKCCHNHCTCIVPVVDHRILAKYPCPCWVGDVMLDVPGLQHVTYLGVGMGVNHHSFAQIHLVLRRKQCSARTEDARFLFFRARRCTCTWWFKDLPVWRQWGVFGPWDAVHHSLMLVLGYWVQ